ncbi:reverse transcriptase [Gossypium australe]|uniref:Reverse transcriptase n=1 Tax=Gossypium australe TaxID=47621 RepID=A0A5B6VL14_9ROSI|nr:reverse transcriptase [Gossypium australe]
MERYNSCLVTFFETKISGIKADNFIRNSSFDNSLKVEAKGFSSGISILWRKELDVNIIQVSNQFIHMIFKFDYHKSSCYATMVYVSPNAKKRVVVWNQLLSIAPLDNEPWVLGGNLNAIVSTNERRGGTRNGGLLDLGYVGPKFTWGRRNLFQRLDRCIGNKEWINMFPNFLVKHLE